MTRAISILCDGNDKVGYGHIRRSLSLFNFLKALDLVPSIKGLSADAQKFLPKPVIEKVKENTIVVIDSPNDVSLLVKEHLDSGHRVICLDSFSIYKPDLTILTFKHPHQSPKGRFVSGLKYAIIRDEFKVLTINKVKSNKTVLVAIGGADVKNQCADIVPLLLDWGYRVNLISGPLTLSSTTEKHPNLDIFHNPRNFPEIMNKSDWCIVNGGGCLFESLYLNKPTYVFPQSQNEENIAHYLSEKKLVLGVGLDNLQPFSFEALLAHHDIAVRIIDEQGLQRITEHIKEFL